jgi:hypothetical protein
MYKVGTKVFDSFEDVIAWAWNEYKIDFCSVQEISEVEKQEACDELLFRINEY